MKTKIEKKPKQVLKLMSENAAMIQTLRKNEEGWRRLRGSGPKLKAGMPLKDVL